MIFYYAFSCQDLWILKYHHIQPPNFRKLGVPDDSQLQFFYLWPTWQVGLRGTSFFEEKNWKNEFEKQNWNLLKIKLVPWFEKAKIAIRILIAILVDRIWYIDIFIGNKISSKKNSWLSSKVESKMKMLEIQI